MPNRLDKMLEKSRASGKGVLAPFLTIGYPDVETSVAIAASLMRAGSDLLELGVPFSDPLAEGSTIQKTSFRALQNGVDVSVCIESVHRLRKKGFESPMILMGYYNPFLQYGLKRFAFDAAAAGAEGVIVPDLPTEESLTLREECTAVNMHLIPLLAPTSTDDRIESACKHASGFIYCVSVAGVTGARANLQHSVRDLVARIRRYTNLPILVGFGISKPEHVAEVGTFADGVVVGSALIQAIEGAADKRASVKTAREFVEGLRLLSK